MAVIRDKNCAIFWGKSRLRGRCDVSRDAATPEQGELEANVTITPVSGRKGLDLATRQILAKCCVFSTNDLLTLDAFLIIYEVVHQTRKIREFQKNCLTWL